jgi:hypothetical protein
MNRIDYNEEDNPIQRDRRKREDEAQRLWRKQWDEAGEEDKKCPDTSGFGTEPKSFCR